MKRETATPPGFAASGLSWRSYVTLGIVGLFALMGCRRSPEVTPSVQRAKPVPKEQRRSTPWGRLKPLARIPASKQPLVKASQREQILYLHGVKIRVVKPITYRQGKLYPCSACHTNEPNRKRRKLAKEHQNHILRHGGKNIWCYHCHSPVKIDKLRLADDTPLSYERSYLLCFQCHGDKARDWVAGIHGRRTGYWRGPKRYLLCTHCHDPHDPKPRKIKPKPMPLRPEQILPRQHH